MSRFSMVEDQLGRLGDVCCCNLLIRVRDVKLAAISVVGASEQLRQGVVILFLLWVMSADVCEALIGATYKVKLLLVCVPSY
jgi:hypothetical protein